MTGIAFECTGLTVVTPVLGINYASFGSTERTLAMKVWNSAM